MKIGIFISVAKNSGGIYQYTSSILKALHDWNTDHEFVIIKWPGNELPIEDFTGPNWSIATIDPRMAHSKNVEQYLSGDGLDLKRSGINPEAEKFFKNHRIDLLILPAPVSVSFEWGVPYIMAIHDLQHRLQPEFPEVSAGNIWKSREYLFRNGARFAEAVLADSEVGKEDVLNFYGDYITPDRVYQLPFLPFYRPDGKEIAEAGKQQIQKKYNLPENFLFYPAQFWLHKNHSRLIHAIHRLRAVHKVDTPLVLAGSNSVGLKEEARELVYQNAMILAEQLGVKDLIRHLGYVSDEDMPFLYAMAKALTMPTFFGPTNIPFLEAWAFGCPVITSDIRGIREQVGNAGLLVDPKNAAAMAEGILKIWSDRDLRNDLIHKGFSRVNSYTSHDFAAKLYTIIESVQHQLQVKSRPSHRNENDNVSKTTDNQADSKNYLVSAIVSTYDAERFIRGRLEDLENQTIADRLEIVVVNSGSQQNEEKIITEFQEKYSNIKYIKTNQRETVYAAWNRGIKASQGKYITNANTDDRLRKDALEVMLNTLEANPEIALVYANVLITETENETFERCTPVAYFDWLDFNREVLLNKGCFVGPQPMWRRNVHDEYGYFDDSFVTSGDYEFWLRISQSRTFMHLAVQLGLYLRSPGSIEHSNREKQREENHKILNMYRKARSSGKIIRRIQVSTSAGHTEPRSDNMKSPEEIYQDIKQSMGNKQPKEVISELEVLAASFPEFALAYNDLGVLYYNSGNKEKALDYYERAVQLDSENGTFNKNLADYYHVEQDRVEDALRIYIKILRSNPEDVETLLVTGHICVSLHKFDEARVFYQKVLELEPWNADAGQNLGKLDKIDITGSNLETPEELYQQIQSSMDRENPQQSIEALEKLVQDFPDYALATNDLGVLYYHTGNKEKAQYHYERAAALMPDNINFQKNLADFYCIELGRIEEALKIYVNILTTHPQDVETLLATGQICVALEKPGDAKDFFNQVLQVEPWNENARQQIKALENQPISKSRQPESPEEAYRKIQNLMKSFSPLEAIGHIEDLVESFPDFAIAFNDLGVLYYNSAEKDKARDCYQKAVKLEPDNITFQKNLADFLFVELSQVEEALQIYVNILAVLPDDIETLLITGHICVAVKKFADAQDFYKRVLEIEPGNADARQNLAALKNHLGKKTTLESGSAHQTPQKEKETTSVEDHRRLPSGSKFEDPNELVSIIISLDGIQSRVKDCVKSIRQHTHEPYEIILINKGATRGILNWVRRLIKENENYQLIECDKKMGWAESFNRAVKAASGEFGVLLHNDVMVAANWLASMLACMNSDSQIGLVGPLTNQAEGIQKDLNADYRSIDLFESYAQKFQKKYQSRRVPTGKLSAFCLMFKRETVEEIGYFDEQFASEEITIEDFCNQVALLGFKNVLAADIYIHHFNRHKANKSGSVTDKMTIEDKKRFKEKWNRLGAESPVSEKLYTLNLLEKADEFNQKGQIDQAIETLLKGIGAIPEDRKFYLALAEILINAGRFQDALDALNEMPPIKNTEMGHSDNGGQQPKDNSQTVLSDSVPQHSQEIKRLELAGYCKEGLGNYSEADNCAERVLTLNPSSAAALNLKGILFCKQNQKEAAEAFFNKAIQSDPGYGEPYTNLGTLKWEAGKETAALDLYERGFILSAAVLDIATLYHSAISTSGEYKRAESITRDAVALYPKNQKLKYMDIDLLIQQGKFNPAMVEIEEAMVKFGIDDGFLAAALKVRDNSGPIQINNSHKRTAVSLCMIVKNEEHDLAGCLASVKPIVDEMIIVDTGSTDRTKDIARIMGATVYDFEWADDFSEARNFSISKAAGHWILVMDADEVLSPLDYKQFKEIVKKAPKAPVAYSIVTRNYSTLANIVGWVPNDGKYSNEEAAIGWMPSAKVRLFYGKDQIRFEGAVHEMVDPVLKRNGIVIKECHIPIHHYGRLNSEKLDHKGEKYFEIGKKKLAEMGDDINAIRELAIQATILEKDTDALELWQRLLSLKPSSRAASEAFVNLGTVFHRMGKFQDALAAAKNAVSYLPDMKEAQYNYATAELHVGNAEKAIAVLENLLNSVPDYPPAQFILAAAYSCGSNKEKGLEDIRKLKGTPFSSVLVFSFLELAKGLISAQRIGYALSVLGAAIENEIVNKELLNLFSECIKLKEEIADSGAVNIQTSQPPFPAVKPEQIAG